MEHNEESGQEETARVPEQIERVKRGRIRIMNSLEDFSLRTLYRNQQIILLITDRLSTSLDFGWVDGVASLCLCVCGCASMCGCQRLMLGVFSNCFPPSFLKTGPLTQSGVNSFNETGWLLSPKDPPVSTQSLGAEITGMHCNALLFIKDARDQNSGVRVCLVSTLLTEAMSAIPSLRYPFCL